MEKRTAALVVMSGKYDPPNKARLLADNPQQPAPSFPFWTGQQLEDSQDGDYY